MKYFCLIPLFLLLCTAIPAVANQSDVKQLLSKSEQNMEQSIDKAVDYAGQALVLAQQQNLKHEEATARFYLAKGYFRAGAYDKALEGCLRALKQFQAIKAIQGEADVLEQMGYIYWKLGDGDKIEEYFLKSLQLRQQLKNPRKLADGLNNVGAAYMHYLGNPDIALKYYRRAMQMSETAGYLTGKANSLNNIGNYFMLQAKIDSSLAYNLSSLSLFRQIKDDNRTAINLLIVGYLYALQSDIASAERYYREALGLSLRIGSNSVRQNIYQNYAALYEQTGDRRKYLEYNKMYYELKDSLSNTETNRNIANLQTQAAVEKQELENRILKLKNQKQRFLLTGLLAFLILGCFAGYYILREKRKSEKLLLNVLPRQVAAELKRYGKASAQTFSDVTVLFSDFAGFTEMSAGLAPEVLIGELTELFTAFDLLVQKHGCERIKTIGDAYLAVCGLPEAQQQHAVRMTHVALGMVEYLKQRNLTTELQWTLRIGLHSGDVVGGIVGIKKYIYDVFGDTINTASRMESSSLPMQINVSQSVYELIRDDFICEPRGELAVKGKGNMQMYFVKGKV